MTPATADRVPNSTADRINRRIHHAIPRRLARYAREPRGIGARLERRDREWDVERAHEANAAAFGLAGVVLGATTDRRWLLLPAAVTAFLMRHAVQGWCPPLPLLRRIGFRTAGEIGRERTTLMALHGDFDRARDGEDRLRAAAAAAAADLADRDG